MLELHNVGIAGITMSANGFQYPEFKVDIETEEGTKTISFPEMLILGIAQSFDLSVEYLVPRLGGCGYSLENGSLKLYVNH